ncbi:transcriptional repressor LexA [Streptomyces sp. MI02-7b]|uniref:transcriptional repressor LexA n=1 Tax=Streptomyces sp. MI02-7b TaxID=462941 RepID=UPI0029ACE740|nr:transcriptional repressor LexA [Streptomyces sp. MI02-7b]MDX3075852.1 transcriptional repressor LexA [Streptomyces sp. MI02-7b]
MTGGIASGPGRPAGETVELDGLTSRQAHIVEVILASVSRRGYPPSMREIGAAVGLTSTSSVAHQVGALQRKGVLEQDPQRARTYRVRASWLRGRSTAAVSHGPVDQLDMGEWERPEIARPAFVPVVGRIAAGVPILAEEVVSDVFPLPRSLVGEGDLFALEVSGDSMTGAAICDGDWVTVRRQQSADNGSIVAAMIDGEATVKRLRQQNGRMWLLPENPSYAPIEGDRAAILGKVVAVIRSL